jgi:hypothetical protein
MIKFNFVIKINTIIKVHDNIESYIYLIPKLTAFILMIKLGKPVEHYLLWFMFYWEKNNFWNIMNDLINNEQ